MTPKKWDGIERRQPREDGREGRRPADFHCSTHEILWRHHDEDKASFRTTTCGKIADLKTVIGEEVEKLGGIDKEIKNSIEELKHDVVGRFWFRIIIGFLMVGIAAVGVQQNWAFKEILDNQKSASTTITSVVHKQVETVNKLGYIEGEIRELHKRQDILRDQHLKLVEKCGPGCTNIK